MRGEPRGIKEGAIFDDIEIGQDIPTVEKGPMTTAHIMRWSAAMENWHRIHYDWKYATQHDGLPDVMVNGSWRWVSDQERTREQVGALMLGGAA